MTREVKRWDYWELSVKAEPDTAVNPFRVCFCCVLTLPGGDEILIKGFYAGDGIWKVRYMPEQLGLYSFHTQSELKLLTGASGCFSCIMNDGCVKGPITPKGERFFHADGSHAFICGTTLYAWWYRPREICEQTLEELKKYSFNKVRMLVMPKYLAGFAEFDLIHQPPCLPFEKINGQFDFTKPVISYFDLLEERILQLREIGVIADVILFHNYDFGMWGIDDAMTDKDAEIYLDYLTARISAFSNVWWSLANEYDIYKNPDGSGCTSVPDRRDWDRLGSYIKSIDPYGRPLSVHNFGPIYPDSPWMTHASIQHSDVYDLLLRIKDEYKKPVINDEYQYEGNLSEDWGNLTGLEGTKRHWLTFMAGCYATHGECYKIGDNRRDIFWTYGGRISGESAARISYLHRLAEGMPFEVMEPALSLCGQYGIYCMHLSDDVIFLLCVCDEAPPDTINLEGVVSSGSSYQVEVHDLWEMKIVRVIESCSAEDTVPLLKIADKSRPLVGVKLSKN